MLCLVSKSCLTLWDPMDCRQPGSSIHGLLQAKILQWVAMSFSNVGEYLNPRLGTSLVGPVAENLPSNAGNVVLIHGWGTKLLHARGQ